MKRGKWVLATLGLMSMGTGIVAAQQPEPRRLQPLSSQVTEGVDFSVDFSAEEARPRRGGLTIIDTPPRYIYQPGEPARYSRGSFPTQAQPVRMQPSPLHAAPLRDQNLQRAAFETMQSPAGPQNSGVIHAEFQPPAGRSETLIPASATLPQNPFAEEAPEEIAPARPTELMLPQPAPASLATQPQPTAPAKPAVEIRTAPAAASLTVSKSSAEQTPMVTIEWVQKSDINVGQECRCDLVVKNSGKVVAESVEVEASFPATVRLTSATPQPADAESKLVWRFLSIEPGQSKTIQVSMIPTQRGALETSASVRFTGSAAASFRVEQPMLKVALAGPNEAFVGEPATQTITVTNPGTGVARNVNIEAMIPKGLEHPRGEKLAMEIGSLSPGESRRVRLSLVALMGGTHALQVRATADAQIVEVAKASIHVVSPSLKMAIEGPGLRYLGRTAKYNLVISNDGQIASNNVRAKYKVPEGYELVKAGQGGKYDPVTETIDWFVGGLDPEKSISVSVELRSNKLGEYTHQAIAVSEHGARTTAQLTSRVEGSAALVLEIQDGNDPVEVGAVTTYEVHIKNEGSKAAGDVGLSCELPVAVEYLSADGPSEHIAENGLVVFKSLPRIAPGQTATFKIKVKGKDAGHHRFRARLASESIREPLIFEELTKFYSE